MLLKSFIYTSATFFSCAFLLFNAVEAVGFSGFVYPDSKRPTSELYISMRLGGSWVKDSGKSYIGHLGEDFVGPTSTPVFVSADGVVEKVVIWPPCPTTLNHGWGPVVIVKHFLYPPNTFDSTSTTLNEGVEVNPSVIYTQYAHLKNISVSPGDQIKKGEKVGEIEYVCGYNPHFHFEVKDAKGYEKDFLYNGGPGSGYSGTHMSAPHRYKPSPFIELNKNLVINDGENSSLADNGASTGEAEALVGGNPFASFLLTLRTFFSNTINYIQSAFADDEDEVIHSPDASPTPTNDADESAAPVAPIYDLQFINSPQTKTVNSGDDLLVVVQAKNTGNQIWKQSDVSVNVVGGGEVNASYRHSTWLTGLRPARLDQEQVLPGAVGTFTFLIKTPTIASASPFRVQVVRQSGDQFLQIGGAFFTVTINSVITSESTESLPTTTSIDSNALQSSAPPLPLPSPPPPSSFEQFTEQVIDSVTKLKESIIALPTFLFHGGGGGNREAGGGGEDVRDTNDIIESDLPANDEEEMITDSSTTTSTTFTTTSIQNDTTPPTTPLVTLAQQSFATPTLQGVWSSTDVSSSVVYFSVEFTTSTGEPFSWQTLIATTTDTQYFFSGERSQTYHIRVRATDGAGNISEWGESNNLTLDWPKTVVVNEIAWMGTGASAVCTRHEWLELYNTTSSSVDLTGWTMVTVSDTGIERIIPLIGSIAPRGYYLLANRNSNRDALRNVTPDLVVTNLSLSDTGTRVTVRNAMLETVDELDFIAGWPAGTKTGGSNELLRQPMERIDVSVPGSAVNNWQTAEQISIFAESNNCGELYGTPRHSNQGYWLLRNPVAYYEHAIVGNTLTLTKDHNPYILTGETEIPAGYELVIEPGVVIIGASPSAYLDIKGVLNVKGTETEPVIFTSARDPAFTFMTTAADTEMAGQFSGSVVAGDWSHIIVQNGGNANIEHAEFRYGGYPRTRSSGFVFGSRSIAQVITNLDSTLSLRDVTFRESYIHDDDTEYNSVIWTESSAVGLAGTSIERAIFDTGRMAIKTDGRNTQLLVTDSSFHDFTSVDGPIETRYIFPSLANNTLTNNIHNGVFLKSLQLAGDATLDSDTSYLFDAVTIPSGVTLTIPAGTNVRMKPYGSFLVSGELQCLGTPDAPIIFSSPSGTSWGGIEFDHGVGRFAYTNFTGGNLRTVSQIQSLIYANSSNVTFDHSTITDIRRPGDMIEAINSAITIRDSTLRWTTPKAQSSWNVNGIRMSGGTLSLDNSYFDMMDYAFYTGQNTTLEMHNTSADHFTNMTFGNWWPPDFGTFVTTSLPIDASVTTTIGG